MRRIKSLKKRAILMPEVLKIIIAVLCIALLAYLAVRLYGIMQAQSEKQKIMGDLNNIIAKVNSISDGDALSYLVIGGKAKYVLIYYDATIVAADPKQAKSMPKNCNEKSCLCFCPYANRDFDIYNHGPNPSEATGLTDWVVDFFYHGVPQQNNQYYYPFEECESLGACAAPAKQIEVNNPLFYSNQISGAANKITNTNWISLYATPKYIYFSSNSGIVTLSNYPGNSPLLNELSGQTEFKGMVRTLVQNCKYTSGKIDSKVFNDFKDEVETSINAFIADKKNQPQNKDLNIRITVFTEDKDGSVDNFVNGGATSFRPYGSIIEDIIPLCSNDFKAFIMIERGLTYEQSKARQGV